MAGIKWAIEDLLPQIENLVKNAVTLNLIKVLWRLSTLP